MTMLSEWAHSHSKSRTLSGGFSCYGKPKVAVQEVFRVSASVPALASPQTCRPGVGGQETHTSWPDQKAHICYEFLTLITLKRSQCVGLSSESLVHVNALTSIQSKTQIFDFIKDLGFTLTVHNSTLCTTVMYIVCMYCMYLSQQREPFPRPPPSLAP